MKKRYVTAIELKEQTLFKKQFYTLRAAEKWACKMVRAILVCEAIATTTSLETGEIMTIITR